MKSFKFALALVLALGLASYAWGNASSTSQVGIDQGATRLFVGPSGTFDVESGGITSYNGVPNWHRTAVATYTVTSGDKGNINTGIQVPNNAVVIGGYVLTTATIVGQAADTLGVGFNAGDTSLLSAHTIDPAYFVAATPRTLTPAFTTGAIVVPATGTSTIWVVLDGTSTLTSGKMNIFVEYYLSNP